MRRAHRTSHALMWTALAVVAAVVITMAWGVRPGEPTNALPDTALEALGAE